MGADPNDGIVDAGLIHHTAHHLLVLGGSVFPTASQLIQPLPLSALSLMAADRFLS